MTLLTQSVNNWLERLPMTIARHRGIVIASLLLIALVGFELFNYSTTFVALQDLLGDITFGPLPWATILAIAFCSIDFAGIARLFLPEDEIAQNKGVWFLFGAWLLAATMNAILTWWSVSLALVEHTPKATAFIDPNLLLQVVPLFVAILVWVTRILLIGTITLAGQRLLSAEPQLKTTAPRAARQPSTFNRTVAPKPMPTPAVNTNMATRRVSHPTVTEPVYVVDEDTQIQDPVESSTGARFL